MINVIKHIARSIITGTATLLVLHTSAQSTARYSLIPFPSSLTPGKGEFVLTPATRIIGEAGDGFEAASAELLRLIPAGKPVKPLPPPSAKPIVLEKDDAISSPEGYRIVITPQQVLLSARTPAGMFRAVETIRQLLPPAVEKKGANRQSLRLPALTITDEPAYAWRGIHLDVARHFFSISYL